MGSSQSLDYAIIGGGIGGLTLGLALHRRGIPIHIYEAAHHFGEIGAGVSFTPNAVQAMQICHPAVQSAFEKICTRNVWPEKQGVWFDGYDGEIAGEEGKSGWQFAIHAALGQNGVYRAHFLDELIKAFPKEKASFGKRLESYSRNDDGKFTLQFKDGTTATAQAIIGCDGIKSHVRANMFGQDHPCAHPSYTHKYAYRALAPMEQAVDAVGQEKAKNACAYLGKDHHLLTFAVDQAKTLNIVGFHSDPGEWKDTTHLTAPAKREDALRDFGHFGPDVQKLLKLAKPDLDVWAIFDLGDNPPPSYACGRVCLLGDAAHATSPHHGAGAGMCIEDAAVLAELLADERIQTHADVEKAFAVYNEVRKPRGDALVQSSRFMGEAWDLRQSSLSTFAELEREIVKRNSVIHDVDVAQMCEDARAKLRGWMQVASAYAVRRERNWCLHGN